jgi:mono/diheme cytochrome c family protein
MKRTALLLISLGLAGLAIMAAAGGRQAPTVERGAKVYAERRCGACHDAQSAPATAPSPMHAIRDAKAGARTHRFAGSRFERGWIETFLMEPPSSGGGLPGIEALSVARYLEMRRDTLLVPEAPELETEKADTAAVAAGQALYEQFACSSCHRLNGEGETIGPELTGVGARLLPAYMAANLRDPQKLWPTSEMPNFGLTSEQVRSIVAYLRAQQP